MAMKRCRSCNGVVSFGAEACPHCGAQLKTSRTGITLALVVVTLLVYLAIVGVQ
jgi:RNA polymerase subunit RPABC4/transcription elongation factor Spt4